MTAPVPDQWLVSPWHLDCPSSNQLGITSTTINCISLAIVIVVGIAGVIQLIMSKKIKTLLKILFYISFGAAMIILIASIAMLSLCVRLEDDMKKFTVPVILFEFGYYILVLCALATLLARLSTTFDDSMFRMSRSIRIIVIVIYILLSLSCIALITMFIITFLSMSKSDPSTVEAYRSIYMWLVLLIWIVYIVSAFWAVYMFCKNIFSLATLQKESKPEEANSSNIALNEFQERMINLSSKYVLLFTIALVSSILVMVLWCYQGLEILSALTICTAAGIDAVITIICLFLQYAFAHKYYNICCKIDICCKKPLTSYMKRKISQSMQKYEQLQCLN